MGPKSLSTAGLSVNAHLQIHSQVSYFKAEESLKSVSFLKSFLAHTAFGNMSVLHKCLQKVAEITARLGFICLHLAGAS